MYLTTSYQYMLGKEGVEERVVKMLDGYSIGCILG